MNNHTPSGLENETDEALFTRYAQHDDERAIATIFTRWQPRIEAFIRKRIKNEAQAEDLTQNTFMRIHRARKTYDPGRKFSTWIHTIANNLLKNEYRSRKRGRGSEMCFTDFQRHTGGQRVNPLDLESNEPNPEGNLMSKEAKAAVRSVLTELPDDFRNPLALRFIDDASYEEIAESCGIPVGTVKSRLNRARKRFRDEYEAQGLPKP